MANCVKIATLGPRPTTVPADMSDRQTVDFMIEHWRDEIATVLGDGPDLIVVPEMCDVPLGWSCERQRAYYEVRGDRILDSFAETARQNHCHVVYPAIRANCDGKPTNAAVVIDRNGGIAGVYHKNHLVMDEQVEGGLSYGREHSVIPCDFGRVACAICFDLNFDSLRLAYARQKPDLVIFSSVYHGGDVIQSYWAFSCRCWFVGAVAGLPSQIRNPFGQVVVSSTNYRNYAVATVNLDCCLAHLDLNQVKLKALKSNYGDSVDIHDPGYWGSVLITSRCESVTALEMAREFEIELLDEYFTRSLEHRDSHMPK